MTSGRVQLAVTVIGRDRPGIIADATRLLAGLGANLEDSTMSILRGHFAMVLARRRGRHRRRGRGSARTAGGRRVAAGVGPRGARGGAGRPARGTYLVSVHGADRPGIVSAVTAVVAEAGGNVTDLSTRLSGELYVLLAEVDLPAARRPRAARPRPGCDRHRARRRGVDAGARPRRPLMLPPLPEGRVRPRSCAPARCSVERGDGGGPAATRTWSRWPPTCWPPSGPSRAASGWLRLRWACPGGSSPSTSPGTLRRGPGTGPMVLVNPVVLAATRWERGREGCLSVPDLTGDVKRATRLVLRAVAARDRRADRDLHRRVRGAGPPARGRPPGRPALPRQGRRRARAARPPGLPVARYRPREHGASTDARPGWRNWHTQGP